jgi:hypothetical protein
MLALACTTRAGRAHSAALACSWRRVARFLCRFLRPPEGGLNEGNRVLTDCDEASRAARLARHLKSYRLGFAVKTVQATHPAGLQKTR